MTTIHHLNIYSEIDDPDLAAQVDDLLQKQGQQLVDKLEELGASPVYAMHAGANGTTNWAEVVEPIELAAVEEQPEQ